MRFLTLSLAIVFLIGCAGHKKHHHHAHKEKQGHKHHPHHRFDDAEKWGKKFNDPNRAEWQKPEEIVKVMGLKTGDTVADLGAGTGYMLPFLSKAVGVSGKVYGLDIETSLIEYMNGYISKNKLENAEARLIGEKDPSLQMFNVSKVLIVNTWHHIQNQEDYVQRIHSGLNDKGEVYIVEPQPGAGGMGPSDEYRVSHSSVERTFKKAGFSCQKERESLPHQYIVKCSK